MKKVMLIGYGAMAQAVIERLPPQVSLLHLHVIIHLWL